ncbi:MAG TPA: 6-carboxytetrahydropterin synthase [Phycisphaerae bacterium]|nr:6-carboxytetrahydropterin synthase [Phycisphaerae bacterium]
MREIRFSIDRDWVRAAHGEEGFQGALPVTNSWGGWPSAVGIAPYLVLRIVVSGEPHPVTGYLVNIQELDVLLRQYAIPLAAQRLSAVGVRLTGESLLLGIFEGIAHRVPGHCQLESLALWTTPHLHYAVYPGDPAMVELTQTFEFSASHRLHVPKLSDDENRQIFGKCNNPNGHGHNYRVEVTIAGEVSEKTGRVAPLPVFEAVVKREIIDRFDHKHLNSDTTEFAEVNPSVENIARTIWGLLADKLSPARLRRVRVWETAKTYAEYEGETPKSRNAEKSK